jgi:transposase InsO family protein
VDNGMAFNGSRVLAFAQEYGIKILNSTPYYAQPNGQA